MKLRVFLFGIFSFVFFSTNFAQVYELWSMTYGGGSQNDGLIFKTDINGENQSVSYSFDLSNLASKGDKPWATLCQGGDGKLYGMTTEGGSSNKGVLYTYDPTNCEYEVKLEFDGSNGATPYGGLTFVASNGKLYGMTELGGANNLGVIFEYNPITEAYTKLLDFTGHVGSANGANPKSSLFLADNDKLYGMTSSGGVNQAGVLFEYNFTSSTYTKIFDFDIISGAHPFGSLMQASNGLLYGVTAFGGINNLGVLFEYNITTNTFTKKVNIDGSQGESPVAELVQATNGKLYGVTVSGGANNDGALFEYDINTNNCIKKLDFDGNSNGDSPYSSLFLANNGLLYGTTIYGGDSDNGVLYEYNPSTNSILVKVNFSELRANTPGSSVIQANDGYLYGVTLGDQINSGGAILYAYNLSSEKCIVRNSFDAGSFGGQPNGSLMQASNGMLYGMAFEGGENTMGIFFGYNPSTQTIIKILDFSGYCDGDHPMGSLMEADNGKLYGMTLAGGTNNNGVLYEYDPSNNVFIKKMDFEDVSKGNYPTSSLIQASNGKLYGLTYLGGTNGNGVLFEYDIYSDTFTKKMDFDETVAGKNENADNYGCNPMGSLVQASNGKLYGTTSKGGLYDSGVLFEYDINSSTYSKLINFSGVSYGTSPHGSLIEINGKLYGMTSEGGTANNGILYQYEISSATFHKLVDFDGANKGSSPYGSLIEASTNKLYGMTRGGGANSKGVLFEYDITGSTFTKKIDFNGTNGAYPYLSNLIKIASSTYTWTGATNNDWNTGSNWLGGIVPQAGNEAIIPVGSSNYPSITSNVTCSNLNIKSNASGDGSLKGQGNLTVSGTTVIERYVSPYTSSSNGWHFLSSPVAGFTIAGSNFEPSSGVDDLYRWGESSKMWLNYNNGTFSHSEFEVGLGYLIAYNTGGVKEFSGSLNSNNYTKNLSYTSTKGDNDGWNLLGNPYPSAIDWDLITKDAGVDGSVYIVNPNDGTFYTWNGSGGDIPNGEIPVNQGFFVKANSSGKTMDIKTNAQVHSVNNYYKKQKPLAKETLKVCLRGENSSNNTYFQFRKDASPQFDHQMDAYKLFGFGKVAQVYSEIDGTQYAINCLPYSNESMSIPLAINIQANEELILDFTGLESFNSEVKIELEDLMAQEIVNIRNHPQYTFKASLSDEANRFLLHFNGITSVEDMEYTKAPLVYSAYGAIYIQGHEITKADVFIYNINGQIIGHDITNGDELQRLNIKVRSGIYIVSIRTNNDIKNYKVYIR